jgi:hypothetical protein
MPKPAANAATAAAAAIRSKNPTNPLPSQAAADAAIGLFNRMTEFNALH